MEGELLCNEEKIMSCEKKWGFERLYVYVRATDEYQGTVGPFEYYNNTCRYYYRYSSE